MILKKLVVFLIALLVIPAVALTADEKDGAIVERQTYHFPSYEKALQTTNIRDIASKEEYERAIHDTNIRVSTLEVDSR